MSYPRWIIGLCALALSSSVCAKPTQPYGPSRAEPVGVAIDLYLGYPYLIGDYAAEGPDWGAGVRYQALESLDVSLEVGALHVYREFAAEDPEWGPVTHFGLVNFVEVSVGARWWLLERDGAFPINLRGGLDIAIPTSCAGTRRWESNDDEIVVECGFDMGVGVILQPGVQWRLAEHFELGINMDFRALFLSETWRRPAAPDEPLTSTSELFSFGGRLYTSFPF